MGLTFRQSQKGKTFGVWLGRWCGCSVKKKVKVTSCIAQYPFLRKMCQLIKYHPAICAVRLHLVHRESYLTAKQGGNIENNGISISLAQ